MNKIIILILFLSLITVPVFADYNISCSRSCSTFSEPSCTGFSTNLQYDNTNSWTYNRQSLPYNTNRSSWIITQDANYGAYSNCNFYEYSSGGSGGCSGTCYYNYTFGLINGSSITPDSYTCTNQSASNSLCENLGGDKKNVWWEAVTYDSNDGSCSGSEILEFNVSTGNCQTDITVLSGQDVNYRYWNYDYAEGTGSCYYSTGATTSNSIGTGEVYDCDVSCDGTPYAFYSNVEVLNGTSTTSYTQNFAGNTTYQGCDSYGSECLGYGQPTNTTYTTGCNCASGQSDLGLFCDESVCYRTCSGNESELITTEELLNSTLEGQLKNQDISSLISFASGVYYPAIGKLSGILIFGTLLLLLLTGLMFIISLVKR